MPFFAPEEEVDTEAQYFVAPDDQISETFYNTGESLGESALNQGLRSLAKVGTGTVEGLSQLADMGVRAVTPESWEPTVTAPFRGLASVAESAQESIEESLPVNRAYADNMAVKAAGAGGQATGQIASLLTGATFTKAPKILQLIGLGEAGAMGVESGYEEADRLGVTDPWQRDALALSYAASEAGVEGFGGFGTKPFVKALTGQIRETLMPSLMRGARTALAEGAEEPITGTLQAGASNVFAPEDPARPGYTLSGAKIPSLDPTSPEFLKARGEEFLLGTAGGGVFAAAQFAGSRPKLEEAKRLHQKAEATILMMEQKPDLTEDEAADLQDLKTQYESLGAVLQNADSPTLEGQPADETPITAAVAMPETALEAPQIPAPDPDVAITAGVVAEEPIPETTDEIQTEVQSIAPITEAIVTTPDSEEPGSEAAVELIGDLPEVPQEPVEPFIAPEQDVELAGEEAWLASPEFTQAEELAAAGDLEAAEALETTFRQGQAQAAAESEVAPEATETPATDLPASEPISAAQLDPHLATLGRSPNVKESDLRSELGFYDDTERTAVQQAIGAPDNRPATLAKALKALQPKTGGKGPSTYQTEHRKEATRRDAVDEQIDRDEGIVRARRRSMRSQNVIYTGVPEQAAETAKTALEEVLPTAEEAWIGTASEVKNAPGLRRAFIQAGRLRDPSLTVEEADAKFETFADSLPGSKMEGFTVGGRPYILIDEVGVTEEDASPERAVRRVLIHEDAHEAVEAAISSDPALEQEWNDIKAEIPAEDLDSLAADRYPWMANWRNSAEIHDDLAHEWIAEQAEILEKRGEPPAGLMQRIFEFFRKVLAKFMGEEPTSISDQRVLDFIEAGRAARSREVRMANPLRPSTQSILGDTDSTSPLRASMQPSYSSTSDEHQAEYDELLKAIPESGRDYVQFLSSKTRTPRISQAVKPMVEYARSLMGSYFGDEVEVTPENTERVKELAAQAFQGGQGFAEQYNQQFRDSGFSDGGRHQGSVATGVLQMEILDYAVRLAGETGDTSLALALMPYANDVAASDHASISNAGRALQLRSMAGQQKGFWTVLNSLAKGERELAEKNPIYKELREALFSDEVQAQTSEAVQKDMESTDAQKVLNPEIRPEDLLDTYLGRAVSIMGEEERALTTQFFNDMAELELLLAKQEAMQVPKGVKASMQAARDMNDPVAIQQRIDELKAKISGGLKALEKFKTSTASKETREKMLAKTPKAKKALSADAQAKKMLESLTKKPRQTKQDVPAWKKTYTDQIKDPRDESDFMADMEKHGISKETAQKLFDEAEKAAAALQAKKREKSRKEAKGSPQAFSAWVGGSEQDGIEDFVDLVTKHLSADGFNQAAFELALSNKFETVDPDLISATAEEVKARLEEQDAEEQGAPEPPDFDARAKKLVTNAIAKKSQAEQKKLQDPMTQAIKARMKGDLDAAAFKGRLLSLGIEPETVFAVNRKVEEDLAVKAVADAQRRAKALAEKMKREAEQPGKTADQIIDALDKQQTEWRPTEQQKNAVRELAAKARKGPDETKGPTTFPSWPEFQKQFEAFGVPPAKAAILVSRLKVENAKTRANRVIRKRESAAGSTAFINSVMKSIFGATLEEQADPAWRRQAMEQAFRDRGFTEGATKAAADWLEYRFDTHIKQAQEKAAQKAAKDLKMKRPTLEKVVKAIRSRGIDPLNANPVTKALAAEAGFAGITPEQFKRLAKLDGQMRGPYQTLRAKAAAEMLDIALAAKPPKKWADILTQAWISSALSSISTMSLSAVHAAFIPVRRLVFDIAGIAGDVATGKTKPVDAAQMVVNQLANLKQSASYMLASAKYAGMNDAYTQHIVEFINQMHSMQADLQRAMGTLRDPNASGKEKGMAAIKVAFTSTDIVRRILSTADETWGSMIQDFILRNESMRQMVQKGGLSPTAAAMLFASASNTGRIAGERHRNETGNELEATLVERDATQNALLEAVRSVTSEKVAEDVGTTASLESPMELGNRRSEDAPLWDFVNTGLEWVKQLAIVTRKKNELAGRMITGFVTVPANILNRSAAFTPLGIARALYKKGKLGGNAEKIRQAYEETMATEGQQRMRLIEGIVGTLMIAILLALKPEDDEEGLVVTGSGPQDKGLREAWLKKGNAPNRIQWVDKKGNVRWSVPYARGGFDHLNLPFTLVGTMDDMKIKGIKPQPANVEWGTQYMHTALQGLFDQAKFFGLKNVAAMPTQMTDRSLASQAAYLAAPVMPWSGLTKSLGRMWTGPTDQSSVQSAILAQLPLTNFYAKPALNALGDQRGPAPTDATWEKALMSGFPFVVGAKNKGKDEDLYTMMIETGVAPNVPLRSMLERKNGLLPDEVWERYLKTRGAIIKQGIRQNLRRFRLMEHKDAQNLMERLSSAATKEAKNRLRLD